MKAIKLFLCAALSVFALAANAQQDIHIHAEIPVVTRGSTIGATAYPIHPGGAAAQVVPAHAPPVVNEQFEREKLQIQHENRMREIMAQRGGGVIVGDEIMIPPSEKPHRWRASNGRLFYGQLVSYNRKTGSVKVKHDNRFSVTSLSALPKDDQIYILKCALRHIP